MDIRKRTTSSGAAGVTGPLGSTDNAIVRFDGITGAVIQNSVGILTDGGDLSGILREAIGSASVIGLSGGVNRYIDFAETITDFTSAATWRMFNTSYALNTAADFAGNSTSQYFLTTIAGSKNYSGLISGLTGISNITGSGVINSVYSNNLQARTDAASTSNITNLFSAYYQTIHAGTGTVSNLSAGLFSSQVTGNGTATFNFGFSAVSGVSAAGGTVGTDATIYLSSPAATGTMTTHYGLYLEDQNLGTNNWAIYTGRGKVQFGDALFLAGDIRSTSATTGAITLQNQTFTPGADHSSFVLRPAWASENFNHIALKISPTQNGANTQSMAGVYLAMAKATGATTLASMWGCVVETPSVAGTVTDSVAINIMDQTNANITTPRGIRFSQTGVANSIVWGNSALQYSSAANNVRFADSTNANGIDVNLLSTALQTINTISTTNGAIVFQNQTMTPGAAYSSVHIKPTFASENFAHNALFLSPTQNGANTSKLGGVIITMNKATAATTLAVMAGVDITAPTVTGTVTTGTAIRIQDQTNANTTTPSGILFTTAGVANSIRWGSSAYQYSAGAEDIRFMDSTNARGISLTMTAAGNQTIQPTAGGLILGTAGQSISFLGGTPQTQQASGANLTNNVTSGGVNDTIADITDQVVYANDAANIRNDIYQLARKLKQVNDALRLYGLLT